MSYKIESSSVFHILETIPKRRRWDRVGFRNFVGKWERKYFKTGLGFGEVLN